MATGTWMSLFYDCIFSPCIPLLSFISLTNLLLCQDNEVHDVPEFDLFFKDFSRAWKSVLAQSDQVLGLKDEKYRSEVKELLQRFKKSTNETLKQKYQKKALVRF